MEDLQEGLKGSLHRQRRLEHDEEPDSGLAKQIENRPVVRLVDLRARPDPGPLEFSSSDGEADGNYFALTDTSSMTKEVRKELSSAPVNFSVTDLPMNELTLIVLST